MSTREDRVRLGAHPHGYLLRPVATPPPPDVAGWTELTDAVPDHVLHLHPRTRFGQAAAPGAGRDGGEARVILLGHPVDVAAAETDPDRIAARLAALEDPTGTTLIREAAVLGGRWTLLTTDGTTGSPRILVLPDTHASQPVFYATAPFTLASTPALVARTLDLPVDEEAVELLAELRRRRRQVTYLPGRRTAYQGLWPLIPNFALTRHPDGSVTHERFWPWRDRVEIDADDPAALETVHERFRTRMAAHTALLAGLGRPGLSLTAGLDSRVTAALAAPALRERDGVTFTYVNPRDARNGAAAMDDVTGASTVAAHLGLPHRVLRWRQPADGSTFDELHRRTYDPLLPSRGAAHAMWADLPADLVQLQSNGAETGTTFLTDRTDEPLSPLRLARMMMHAREGLEDLAEAMYGDYLEHAPMEDLRGYDHHDVFYWEQRMGRWGWQKFVDGDFGHRILLPFNDRVLLEVMLSLPYRLRADKVLLRRVLAGVPGVALPTDRARVPRVARGRLATLGDRARSAITRMKDVAQRTRSGPAYTVLEVDDPAELPGRLGAALGAQTTAVVLVVGVAGSDENADTGTEDAADRALLEALLAWRAGPRDHVPPVSALTWWNRHAPDEVAARVFTANRVAVDAGLSHRVVEDDGDLPTVLKEAVPDGGVVVLRSGQRGVVGQP